MTSLSQEQSSLSASAISTIIVLPFVSSYTILASKGYKFSSRAPTKIKRRLADLWGSSVSSMLPGTNLFQHGRAQTLSGNFSFFVGKYPVIGLTGDKARQIFFQSQDLGFDQGYAVLLASSPTDVKRAYTSDKSSIRGPERYFLRRLLSIVSTANLDRKCSKLFKDIRNQLDVLEGNPSGLTDPFGSIYGIVYQLNIRMQGCDDIAEDPKLLAKTPKHYRNIEESSTPMAIMFFPWFTSPAVIQRAYGSRRLLEDRKKTGTSGDDALQFLIDQGDSISKIIEFIIFGLFSGLVNSGIDTRLGSHVSCWRTQVKAEVEATATKYTTKKDAPWPPIDQLKDIPINT